MPNDRPQPIFIDDLEFVGAGLHRPECVLCTAGGDVFASDWRGGVIRIRPGGSQQFIQAEPDDDRPVRPNGIALLPDASFLLADLGNERGGVWRLYPDGRLEPYLVKIDGETLPPANFVYLDDDGRVWITVSTRVKPRTDDYRPSSSSGFVLMVDGAGPHLVADRLGYANECRVDPSGRYLYVNETFGRRLTRFRIREDGLLGEPELVTAFGEGTFPDGLAFDAEGGIWVASIVSNRIIRVEPDGGKHVVLEDANSRHVAWVEDAFQHAVMGRPHLDTIQSRVLRSTTSVAFGGQDLRTLHVGCLLGSQIATVRAPVAGRPPAHWTFDVSPLDDL